MNTIWNSFIHSPFFGIFLSIGSYLIGCFVSKKIKSPLAGKLLVAIILCCTFLCVFKIPYNLYNSSASILTVFLAPATASIAVSMYNELETLRKNIIPIIAGTFVGSAASVLSILLMCRIFGLEKQITMAIVPKSITMTIALGITEANGGIPAITIVAISYTGNLGAMLATSLIKIFRVKNKVAAGIAIGTSSHTTGSSKALDIGSVEGATSGLAVGCAGVMTVIICAILSAVGVLG